MGWALRRTRELADPLLGDVLGVRAPGGEVASGAEVVRTGPPEPAGALPPGSTLPPRRLRARAGAGGGYAFIEGGRQAAAEVAGLVRSAGRDPAQLRSVLDFGCGPGRVLPHFAALAPEAACVGCDVDAAAVDWAARAHRSLGWSLTSFHPPLPYEDDRFDLVYSISVFSHLAGAWPPCGWPSCAGCWHRAGWRCSRSTARTPSSSSAPARVPTAWCSPAVFRRGPLGSGEFVFAPYRRSFWTDGDLPGVGREYGLAFHGSEHTLASWGRALQVVEVRARALTDWQDVAVCLNC